MQGIKSQQGSRFRNYQTSDEEDYNQQENQFQSNNSPHFQEEPDQVEILFDANEALAGFGNPSANSKYNASAYGNNQEDDIGGERMGSGDSSGFYDHEDASEPQMAEPKNFSSVKTPSEVPTDLEEIEKGFSDQNDVYQFEAKQEPASLPAYTQDRDLPNSYMNYQISSAARAAYNNKKKHQPPVRNKQAVSNTKANKPDILGMNDDIGEVGEWVGKSANVNIRNEDSEEDDEEKRNKSDEFEGVFEQTEPRVTKPLKEKRSGEDGDEEKERGEKYEPTQNLASIADQSNRAMQKAQDSALKAAKNKGPFMNNLKAKAKNLQTKAQDEVVAAADGEVKLKMEVPNVPVLAEDEELEDLGEPLFNLKAGIQEKKQNIQQIQKPEIPKLELGINGLREKKPTQEKSDIPYNKLDEKNAQSQALDEIMNQQIPTKQIGSPIIDEWEAVSKATSQQVNGKRQKENTKLVMFTEAWEIARNFNLAEQKKKVQQDLQTSRSFIQKLLGSCSGSGLSASLLDERDHVLALAKVPFSEEEPLYFEILKTLYITLTGKTEPVPRFGTHWEIIGFQGRDPATDLRGVGVLGLLQLLAFLSSHEKLFKKMFEHSIHEKYNFPLSICGLSITQSVMELVRAGRLNSSINSKRSVINAMNEVYFATFYKLYSIYKANSYTIQDYPKAKMTATTLLQANPSVLVNEFNNTISPNSL